jgi:hypothetical protein
MSVPLVFPERDVPGFDGDWEALRAKILVSTTTLGIACTAGISCPLIRFSSNRRPEHRSIRIARL